MKSSSKWALSYALQLIRSAKKQLFFCVILSSAYAYALYVIGDKVQFQGPMEITAISLGAFSVLFFKLLTQIYADMVSINLSASAQLEVVKQLEKRLSHLKTTLNDSQILHRLTVDFTQFSESLIRGVIQILTQGLITILVGGYLIYQYQKELPQIMLFLGLGITLSLSLHLILKSLTGKKAQSDSDVFRFQKNIVAGSDYLITSNRFPSWVDKYHEKLRQQMVHDRRISLLQHSSSTLSWGARYIFILIIISPLVMGNSLSSVSIYWLYIMLGLCTQLFWTLFHFGQVRIYASRAHKVIENSTIPMPVQHQDVLSVEAKKLNVFFGPKHQKLGLKDLNFSWKINDKVWLEGPSGAGKTTLLKSILGLHTNFTGSLRVPGKKFKVAYLSQDPFFFDGESLGDNLNIYTLSNSFKETADKLNLTSFFENINWDLNTPIGSEGVLPSRGQRLRLGLLRELLREPDLLLLDEPSASLDLETARQVFSFLEEVSGEKIIVICEHKKEFSDLFIPTQKLSLEFDS